jgi:hypothetical protein
MRYNFSNTEVAQIRQVDKPIINELNILKNLNNILHITYIQYIDIGDITGFGYDNRTTYTEFNHVLDNGFKKFVTALNWYFRDINEKLLQLELQKGIIEEINNTNYMTFNYTYTEISDSETLVRIPKPIKPSNSNTSNIVTYAQFVKFGTLHGFGYSNINDIENWADFVTAINNYLININDRINELNNEPSIPSDNYWYVGTTKPTSLSEIETVSEYQSEVIYTNNSGAKSKIYVVTDTNHNVTFYNPQFNTELGQIDVDVTTIPGCKIYETSGKTGNTGTIKIVIS